ncbi:MAG: GTP cyclohydrolase FolE2 [Caldisericia bacterium]|nr:GTP cyclohydrolase FolE2 [Caldisericia bacterium]
MRDIQNETDDRKVKLDRVGVQGVRYPISVSDREGSTQSTTGLVSLYVDLPKEFRGTHMSRFIEILNIHRDNIAILSLEGILQDTKRALKAETSHIEIQFTFFINKAAPVTGIKSFLSYDCTFIASKAIDFDFVMQVKVPIQLLCPCSKEISSYGAHNQRGTASVSIRMKHGQQNIVWIEELVSICEKAASSPVYSLLKRKDEKYVTEYAYNHPRFVEDVVRNIYLPLQQDPRVTWFSIDVLSNESIHNHNAYAQVEKDNRDEC